MARTTYKAMSHGEAAGAGASEALLAQFPDPGWNEYASGVVRCEDGVPVELLGTDGGEPEDQTLGRDWSWVPGALLEAYARGAYEATQGA